MITQLVIKSQSTSLDCVAGEIDSDKCMLAYLKPVIILSFSALETNFPFTLLSQYLSMS